MPFSCRSAPCASLPLGAPLLAALLFAPVARAGNDDSSGHVAASELVEEAQGEANARAELFYGDHGNRDSRHDRGLRLHEDRALGLGDPDATRRLMAEELLAGLENRLNEGRWIPFRNRHRKSPGPQVLLELQDTEPEPPIGGDDSWRSRFRVNLTRGLEYRQEFGAGEERDKLQMRVYGPVVPGGPGLGLQLRGRALDRRFRLNAYGGASEAGVTVDFEF
jgi:hypothetical protein